MLTEREMRERGITRGYEEFMSDLRSMGEMVLLAMPAGRGVGDPGREFTSGEAEVLERGGLDLSPWESEEERGGEEALGLTASRYALMLAGGLGTGEAAGRLGVSDGRVRQRLAERSLYGIKTGRGYRLPAFQFARDGEVPRVGEVLRALPPGLHPVAVENWFTGPNPDLYLDEEEERPISPWEWLMAGGSPEAVVPLAGALAAGS